MGLFVTTAKHTHLAYNLKQSKEDQGKVEHLQAQLLLHTNEVSQQITIYELQNGHCFPSSLQISQESLWLILTRNKQENEFWEIYLSLAKLTYYKAIKIHPYSIWHPYASP